MLKEVSNDWEDVIIFHKKNKYAFPQHMPSGEIFNIDPDLLIRGKCLALVGLTPLFSVARSIYWLATAFFQSLALAYHYLDGQEITSDEKAHIMCKLSDSVRAIGYGANMTRWAVIGLFTPREARLHYGHLERALNRHVDGPHRNKFYLAICFQRLCVMPSDKGDYEAHVTSKLTKYLVRIDIIRNAIRSCSYHQLMNELSAMRGAL